MNTYEVTIRAIVTKTYSIEADNESNAIKAAHDQFSVLDEDDIPEHYNQETVSACLVKLEDMR